MGRFMSGWNLLFNLFMLASEIVYSQSPIPTMLSALDYKDIRVSVAGATTTQSWCAPHLCVVLFVINGREPQHLNPFILLFLFPNMPLIMELCWSSVICLETLYFLIQQFMCFFMTYSFSVI